MINNRTLDLANNYEYDKQQQLDVTKPTVTTVTRTCSTGSSRNKAGNGSHPTWVVSPHKSTHRPRRQQEAKNINGVIANCPTSESHRVFSSVFSNYITRFPRLAAKLAASWYLHHLCMLQHLTVISQASLFDPSEPVTLRERVWKRLT